MAENYKDKITQPQYDIMKHNVYTLDKEDDIYDKYCGCGCGWIEIDTEGKADIIDWETMVLMIGMTSIVK